MLQGLSGFLVQAEVPEACQIWSQRVPGAILPVQRQTTDLDTPAFAADEGPLGYIDR